MIAWLKKHWPWLAGILLAIAAVWSRRSGALPLDAVKGKQQADSLKSAAQESDRQQQARLQAAENVKRLKEEADKRLEELKRRAGRTGMLVLLLCVLCAFVVGIPARAQDPLAAKYEQALAQIAELVKQRDEAIDLADTYKSLYEQADALRAQAEASLTAARQREDELQRIIDSQWKTILELSARKSFSISVGAVVDPIRPLQTKLLVALERQL